MITSSQPLSVPEFLRRSTVGPDGNPYLETIRRPIFNAWSVDKTLRHPSQFQAVSCSKHLHESTKVNGRGALSLEHLARRQIVQHHLNELNETVLTRLEWYGRGKKLWEDILASGEDNWRVFVRFCSVYGHEKDFMAMLENPGAGLMTRDEETRVESSTPPSTSTSGRYQSTFYGPPPYGPPTYGPPTYGPPTYGPPTYGPPTYGPPTYGPPTYGPSTYGPPTYGPPPPPIRTITPPPPTSIMGNKFRYRTQMIKNPLPPWQSSIPLLTAPTPKLNNGDFSWLVCLELTTQAFDEQTWSHHDLQFYLGTLPNLAVLSVHGPSFLYSPYRIVEDGYLNEWARHARQGQKWGALRVLVLEEKLEGLMSTYRPHPRHHSEFSKNPPPPPPPPKRGLFEELDSFPKLSVVSFHLPPPPVGWGDRECMEDPSTKGTYLARCVYPLFNYERTRELFAEADRRGWYSERVKDFHGTLKDRPREVKELMRKGGLSDVKSLAQAAAMLVECEGKEKKRLERERRDAEIARQQPIWIDDEEPVGKLHKKKQGKTKGEPIWIDVEEPVGKSHKKGQGKAKGDYGKRDVKSKSSVPKQPTPTSNVIPPIMVNVIFDTNSPPDSLHPSNQLLGFAGLAPKYNTNYRSGRESPTDQENFHERRIMFEKKRVVELSPLPVKESKKRKESGHGINHGSGGVLDDFMKWNLDGAGDDFDEGGVDGNLMNWGTHRGSSGTGSEGGKKKVKMAAGGEEMGRDIGDFLRDFMY